MHPLTIAVDTDRSAPVTIDARYQQLPLFGRARIGLAVLLATLLIAAGVAVAWAFLNDDGAPKVTPTPGPTPTLTPSESPTASPMPTTTGSPSPSPSESPTPTASASPSPSATPTLFQRIGGDWDFRSISDDTLQAAIASGSLSITAATESEPLDVEWSFTTDESITWTCVGELRPESSEVTPRRYMVVDGDGNLVAFLLGQAPVAAARDLCGIEITPFGERLGEFPFTVIVAGDRSPASTFQMRSSETGITLSWRRP